MIIKFPTTQVPELYKENKKFGRLIRSQVFDVENNDVDAKYQITYVKLCESSYDVQVNIKITGTWKRYDWRNNTRECSLTSYIAKENARSRNREIRWAVNGQLRRFFSLMGVPGYNIKVGTILIKDKL